MKNNLKDVDISELVGQVEKINLNDLFTESFLGEINIDPSLGINSDIIGGEDLQKLLDEINESTIVTVDPNKLVGNTNLVKGDIDFGEEEFEYSDVITGVMNTHNYTTFEDDGFTYCESGDIVSIK